MSKNKPINQSDENNDNNNDNDNNNNNDNYDDQDQIDQRDQIDHRDRRDQRDQRDYQDEQPVKATPKPIKDYYESFEDMGLKEHLLRGIFGYGFESPSNIQAQAIVPIMSGGDIIAQSQSGSGKTGAFVISALQRLDESTNGIQCMILSPTRELSQQIYDVCSNIGQHTTAKFVSCIGGTRMDECKRLLNKGPVIVIGTPGRILDMIQRRYLNLETLRMFILDEADEMMSESFENQLKEIVNYIPMTAQMCLFSATIPREILDISKQIMKNPKVILVKQEQLTLDGIKQFYVNVERDDYKFDVLCKLYSSISVSQSIIYVNTKQRAMKLERMLLDEKNSVSLMHSGMKPNERESVMKDFRSGISRILISTDLLSRGIDVQQVSIVINYDLPGKKESYLHRIGRSGRFGRKGVAINFVTNREFNKLDDLENFYSTKIESLPDNFEDYLN